ncbi:MAG: hypothetical protein A2076_09190 [Geobacteraceae bacterium GWC2_53_11]|nr:MAG: hypothetical protein A2076_09190 [Geobacteraceae bacterium GWC2_53_11]
MPAAPASAIPGTYRFPLFIILIAAGLAGNYFNYPLFLNIDFLFGSIFALLALQFFGPGRAVLAAAIISGYTYFLWNHPYAIIIMTTEVAAVAWIMGRRKIGLIQADAIYWLLVGMPLIYFFYHIIMHVPPSNTYITMTKQAVNGFANALAARLLFTGYLLWSRSSLISFREIVYNMLAFFVVCPALITLAVESRIDFTSIDRRISEALIHDSQQTDQRLNTWIENRKSAILTLAGMAATRSPQQMQPYLELAKKSDVNFERIGLLDRDAVTTAYYPLVDEQGSSNIGKNFADRPYVPTLKQTLKPMLSEVVISKIGRPRQIVMMLAPVVSHGTFNGYIVGVLGLEQIREYLNASTREKTSIFTLVDTNGNIIMTNRSDQKVMTRFVRGSGVLHHLPNGLRMWVPVLSPGTPSSEKWKESFYVSESAFGTLSEWRLILEQPVAPFQKALYDQYTGKLALLFLVLILLLALAEFLSRKIVVTLAQLRTLTHELPHKLAANTADIAWPESIIKEANHLINNFRQMANTLTAQFIETRKVNESLEQRVEERTAELRESEALYRSILNASPDDIVITDMNRQIRMLSPIGITMFGYEREEEIIGHTIFEFIAPEDRERAAGDMSLLSAGTHPGTCEYCGLRADGSEFAIEVNSDVIRDKNGLLNCIVLIVRDITDRKHAEEELRQAKEDADAANLAKSRFLANMSHEIRTPMNGVVGLTELLLGTNLSAKQREYAELVKRSGKILMQLISDILDLSKIEVHKIVLETRDFDLGSETLATINLLSLHAQEKGLGLTSCIDPDVPRLLRGDPGRLRQIITNLIGNAIKFATKGSILLLIRKEDESEHTVTLRISVRDSGIGIAADKLNTIFDPFTQADSSTTRNYGGTGLGLTISKQLTELMGGTIGVESVEGEGSTFWFTVVVAKQLDMPLIDDRHQTEIRRTFEPHGKEPESQAISALPRILLAEDDPTNQLVTLSILDRFGYQADLANNGSEALALLEQNDYGLVLMDCMMPLMNGYEATSIIRDPASSVRNHEIPVIALTANAMQEDSDNCYSSGMNDYLTKPFDVSELLAILDKWLVIKSAYFTPAVAPADTNPEVSCPGLNDFNRDEFIRRNLGDVELCHDVAGIFFDHGPEYLQAIRTAVELKDCEAVRQSSHKLKGAAANLALPKVHETAALIETAAKDNKLDNAAQLLIELEVLFVQAEQAVHELLLDARTVPEAPYNSPEERQHHEHPDS